MHDDDRPRDTWNPWRLLDIPPIYWIAGILLALWLIGVNSQGCCDPGPVDDFHQESRW